MCCHLPSDMTHLSLAQTTVGQNSMLAVGHPDIFLENIMHLHCFLPH